jgi:hypothetical protein
LPWPWNAWSVGSVPTRERCLSVGTPKDTEQAVALVAAFREQEEIASTHDIESMSLELDRMGRTSRNAHGGVPGELLRRRIRAADPEKFNATQTRLAEPGRRQWT